MLPSEVFKALKWFPEETIEQAITWAEHWLIVEVTIARAEKAEALFPRWIPVTEEFPEYGVRVLVIWYNPLRIEQKKEPSIAILQRDSCWWFWKFEDQSRKWDKADFWMPLPPNE